MDLSHRIYRFIGFSPVQKRISELSKIIIPKLGIQIDQRFQKWILGLLLCLVACFIGFWAELSSKRDAVKEWERIHHPTRQMWTLSLNGLGFHPSQSPEDFEAALGQGGTAHPESAVELSEDWNWVLLNGTETENPALFCRNCRQKPERKWNDMGKGWLAFETTLSRLQEHPIQSESVKAGPSIFHDYREIRY